MPSGLDAIAVSRDYLKAVGLRLDGQLLNSVRQYLAVRMQRNRLVGLETGGTQPVDLTGVRAAPRCWTYRTIFTVGYSSEIFNLVIPCDLFFECLG